MFIEEGHNNTAKLQKLHVFVTFSGVLAVEVTWCASEACRGHCSCVCAALPSMYIWLLLAPLILGSNQFVFDLPNTSLNQGPWLEQERKTGQKLRQILFCLQGHAGRTETAPLFVCGVGLRATTTSLERITFALTTVQKLTSTRSNTARSSFQTLMAPSLKCRPLLSTCH